MWMDASQELTMWRELLNKFEAAKTPEEQAAMTKEAIRVMLKDLADFEEGEPDRALRVKNTVI